jgi:hypothetical protein
MFGAPPAPVAPKAPTETRTASRTHKAVNLTYSRPVQTSHRDPPSLPTGGGLSVDVELRKV